MSSTRTFFSEEFKLNVISKIFHGVFIAKRKLFNFTIMHTYYSVYLHVVLYNWGTKCVWCSILNMSIIFIMSLLQSLHSASRKCLIRCCTMLRWIGLYRKNWYPFSKLLNYSKTHISSDTFLNICINNLCDFFLIKKFYLTKNLSISVLFLKKLSISRILLVVIKCTIFQKKITILEKWKTNYVNFQIC